MSDICPACGNNNPNPDRPLCVYCYYRGKIGTMKMMLLDIFSKSGKHLTLKEISTTFDAFHFKGKNPTKEASLSRLLLHYKNLGLITAKKERKKCIGRPRILYKITRKGKKRLISYLKRWRLGLPVILDHSRKKRFKLTADYRERASSIRGKLKKQDNIFEYIMY